MAITGVNDKCHLCVQRKKINLNKMLQMKTLLVPTDFSKCAENALNYAIALAKKENMKIILLHAFHFAYVTPDVPIELIAEQIALMERNAKKQMDLLLVKSFQKEKIKYECITKQGLAVDLILDVIGKRKPYMIIMGTKGASGIKEVLLGNNTTKIIEKAKCPVIAVPEKALFKGIKRITYASDYHSADIIAIKKMVEIVKPFKALINILHISDKQEYTEDYETTLLKSFAKKISDKINYRNFSFHLIFGNSIESEIKKHIKSKTPDIIALSTRHRNLIERIFEKSITKKIVNHINIPLLVFHYKQQSVVFI